MIPSRSVAASNPVTCVHRDAIEQFIGYFEGHIKTIEAVKPVVYRKLLYAAALDPLARAAFGDIKHRERITRLIDDLTSWPAKKLVSLPQLELALKEQERTRFRLYRRVHGQLKQWAPGHVLRIIESPPLAELQPFASPEEQKTLNRCRYTALFYTYRNNLVHEFRQPGYGIEMSSDKYKDQPYYHSEIGGPWQLVFPVAFFSSLYKDAVRGLETFLKRHDRDPYEQFRFGSLWRS